MAVEHAHLEELVAQMVEHGNALSTPFRPSQGGWFAVMEKPLDAALCRAAAVENPQIAFNADDDSLFCAHCWADIFGGAHRFPTASRQIKIR